ncbi:porin PorA family protein [Rhodococcus sp. AQ5-07]|uniref:porin PorA family protein n=1 Tax=Rhodococcus sp. AQ5-07 TaxID=2054902 RepID=UPI001E5EEE7E|nr:porin PorA family protein [Rhodococcus sp. AQ5-07]
MTLRKSSIILMALGVVLVVLAAITRWVVAPELSKLPSDTDVTAQYAGKATLLNAEALKTGDAAHAISRDVPVTIDRHVYVSSTDGDTAVVHDDTTLNTPSGPGTTKGHTYAIDRKTMQAAPAPTGETVQSHEGLTITLPLSPKPDNSYQYYDSGTQQTVPVTYVEKDIIDGRDAYNYTIVATGALKDPATLNALPPALPKALMASLAPALPPNLREQLAGALDELPDPVPLTYTANDTVNLYADESLGATLDAALVQEVIANIEIGGQQVSLLPVLKIDAQLTPESRSDAVNKANDGAKKLALIKVWVPLVLLVVGITFFICGFIRRRKPQL